MKIEKYSKKERALADAYLEDRKAKSFDHEVWTHEDELLVYYSFMDGRRAPLFDDEIYTTKSGWYSMVFVMLGIGLVVGALIASL